MRIHATFFVFFAVATLLMATTANAQELDTKAGVVIKYSPKWKEAKTTKGAKAVLRSTVDKKAQIEFRMAPKLDDAKAQQFFKSFHTNLQNAGLKVVTPKKEATYAKQQGSETEYVTKGKKGNFRLVLFEFHHKKHGAWLVVGFFAERQRDSYYKQFQEVLNGLVVAE